MTPAQRERLRRHRQSAALRYALSYGAWCERCGYPSHPAALDVAWSIGWHAGRLWALREARADGRPAEHRSARDATTRPACLRPV